MIRYSPVVPRAAARLALALACLLPLASWGAAPPANDTCAGRQTIPPAGPFPHRTTTVDISGATTTGDPPFGLSCPDQASSSVWYEFRPQTTALYTISTCADDGTATTVSDTVMSIYVDSGTPCSGFVQVACEDDVCGVERLQAAITTQLVADTTYYVVVWRFGTGAAPPSSLAQLQLIVSLGQAPANDLCTAATELPLNLALKGSTVAAANDYQLSPAAARGREVVYQFTPPGNGTYSFTVRDYRGDNLSLYATTHCPAGPGPVTVTEVVATADRNPASTAEELYCVSLTAGQRVFVFVDEGNANHPGSSFSIEATQCVREREPNNTIAGADALPCGIRGTIAPSGDVDFFALGTFPNGYRAFAMVDASAANAPSITLRAETAESLLEIDNGDNAEAFGELASNLAGVILTNQPAYLRVSYFANNTNEPYRLYAVVRPPLSAAQVESEPNNLPAVANTGSYFRGSIGVGDQDLFTFNAQAGDLLFVSLDGDPTRDNSRLQAQLSLLDSAGVELITVDDVNQLSYPPGEALVFRAPGTGPYFVRVAAGAGMASTGDYLLSISRNCFPSNGANTPPALTNATVTSPVSEGGVMILRGNVSDPDTGEAFRLVIAWGDGSPDTVTNLPPGLNAFEVSHTVVDDPPGGTAQDATHVTVTVSDRAGAAQSTNVPVTLRNVAPSTLTLTPSPATLNEGAATTLTCAFIDPGASDTHTLVISWGDGSTTATEIPAGTRLVQVSHVYIDNASTISAIVTDDDTGSVTNSAPVSVNNVNPVLSNVGITSPIWPNDTATLSGSFSDAGAADAFLLTIDWGDGTAPQALPYPAGPGSFNFQHQYSVVNATLPVTLTLRDDDTGSTTHTTSVVVRPRPQGALFLAISNAPSGSTILHLQGSPHATYLLQGSSNLLSWQTLGTRTAASDGRFSFEDAAAPRPVRSFYRAVVP